MVNCALGSLTRLLDGRSMKVKYRAGGAPRRELRFRRKSELGDQYRVRLSGAPQCLD